MEKLKKVIKGFRSSFGSTGFAFSLIEILLALIIVATIAAAFAPAISKKAKVSNHKVNDYALSNSCTTIDPECVLCNKNTNKCLMCNTGYNVASDERSCEEIPQEEACEVPHCTICVTGNPSQCQTCESGYFKYGDGKCVTPTLVTKGGLQWAVYNAGAGQKAPSSDANLTSDNMQYGPVIPFVGYDYGTGSSFEGKVHRCGSVGSCSQYQANCWVGTTGNTSKCHAGDGHYSGCYRTVCNWEAANIICAFNGMRLPTNNEIKNKIGTTYSPTSGLYLCERSGGTSGVSRCTEWKNGNYCKTSNSGYCRPNNLWSSQGSAGHYSKSNYFSLSGTTLSGPNQEPSNMPYSFRCVKE